jgi:hypothetical protein
MKRILYLMVVFFALLRTTPAQTIPKQLWGKWIVRREVPTTTISCWGQEEAKTLIGTQIEYSVSFFRWHKVITKNPTAEITTLTAEQFHDGNSGKGTNSSQVTFRRLGIKADKVTQVVIQHPAANITSATTEIPGDSVLIKDKNTIIFSICSLYFEAERSVTPLRNQAAGWRTLGIWFFKGVGLDSTL